MATRASLQRPYNDQILTPADFYSFCEKNIENIDFKFAKEDDHHNEVEILQDRRERATTIAGTQKFHCFKPVNSFTLEVRHFSSSRDSMVKKVADNLENLPQNEISGYVTVTYDQKWYVGYVMEKDCSKKEALVTFLQPNGPSRSFTYPSKDDILIVPFSDILTSVEIQTTNCRTYFVGKKYQERASLMNGKQM